MPPGRIGRNAVVGQRSSAGPYARGMSGETTPPAPGLVPTVALYTSARLGLLALIVLVLSLAGVPILIATLVGLVVALPLSMVLFRGLRSRLDAAVAAANGRRSTERDALRARLRGDAE